MSRQKKACVIYVNSNKDELPRVQEELEQNGYAVCSALASTEAARGLLHDESDVSETIRNCISNAELCIFLIPEELEQDGEIHGAASVAGQLGKRMVGLVGGARTVYPQEFDIAGAIIRISSARLANVIQGEDVWESADNAPIKDRVIDHQKCQ
ncbi:hypothetical protein K4L06_17730 [Lysobacter sp. BMK333-48F3]|uniref:hypothetical protein n=1 Tax=Lysobacter sp. BMK333-48F3 TaxID=2867962 RepID=UPI001C8B6899|nr:hypothetical protein [Lysobacter sp. BMK333-48F3]MBX9403153.1 hypothetical protein [Lysobacter sp. BMK333-48F3]